MEEKFVKVVLKSAHPEEYPDLVVECRVIPNDMIGKYLDKIPAERKFYAHKNGEVEARLSTPGEKVTSTLLTIVDGKEYILSEETATAKERECDGVLRPDVVVRNVSSTSNEEYVVKYEKFRSTYEVGSGDMSTGLVRCVPVPESRLFTQVDENVVIMTLWGEPAVCLAGSYIVTYNASGNDYNTVEQGAFRSTYEVELEKTKKIKRG